MVKKLQLNVHNHASDSQYAQDFILKFEHDEQKFFDDCAAWEDWITKNRKGFETDDYLIEEYWENLGYVIEYVEPQYDFVMDVF